MSAFLDYVFNTLAAAISPCSHLTSSGQGIHITSNLPSMYAFCVLMASSQTNRKVSADIGQCVSCYISVSVWVQTLWRKHGDIGPIPIWTFTRHDGQHSNLLFAPRPSYLWQPTELRSINNSTYVARDLLKTWICKTFIRPFLIRKNKWDIPSTRLKCQRSDSPNQVDTKIHEINSRSAIRLMKRIVAQRVKKVCEFYAI